MSAKTIVLTSRRLEKIWLNAGPNPNGSSTPAGDLAQADREESTASSVSLGDTHIWRDNGEANV